MADQAGNNAFVRTLMARDQPEYVMVADPGRFRLATVLGQWAVAGQPVAPPNNPAMTFTGELTQAGTLYTAVDGRSRYFIPQALVARRRKGSQSPAIFIRRQRLAQTGTSGPNYSDTLEVTLDLLRPPDAPADAQMLPPVDNFSVTVTLYPKEGRPIPFTAVQFKPPADGDTALAGQLFAALDVTKDLANILDILQNQNGATFGVQATVAYWFQPPTPAGSTGVFTRPAFQIPLAIRVAGLNLAEEGPEGAERAEQAAEEEAPQAREGLDATDIADLQIGRFVGRRPRFDDTVADLQDPPRAITPPAPPPPQSRSMAVALLAAGDQSAYFPIMLPPNRPIYAMVASGLSADPDTLWVATPDGYFMESAVPNQYYVLPDGYGLAYDAAQNMPGMAALLVKGGDAGATGAAAYRVRVSFTVAPWLDTRRLARLRRRIRDYTGGTVAYADLLIGGAAATFEPTRLFDQLGSSVVGAGGATATDAARGFELVLDCTIEFYTLLTRLLTGSGPGGDQGLQGRVLFSLKTKADPDAPPTPGSVDVHLRLDQPSTHPLTFQQEAAPTPAAPPPAPAVPPADAPPADAPPADAPPVPITITVNNPSPVPVKVGRVLADMLRTEGLPYPIASGEATVDPAGLAVPPQGQMTVTVTPPTPPELWDTLDIRFADVTMTFDPAAVLNQVQQLASTAGLKSSIYVWSYLLKNPTEIPPELAGLIGIHVQIQQGTATPIDVVLTKNNTEQTVPLAFSLADIVAGQSPEQPTFKYRRFNLYASKPPSAYSEWETNTGNNLFVAPVGL